MSHLCNSTSCSHEGHSHADEQSCHCCCHQHCHCPCHQHSGKYADQLLHVADEAWMEVIKEKIKEEIRQHSGDHLTKLAKLVSQANHKRWTEKLSERKGELDFEERLKEMMFNQNSKH